jgi:hypothetical protein
MEVRTLQASQAERMLERNAKVSPRAVHLVDEEVLEPVSLEYCPLVLPVIIQSIHHTNVLSQ